MGRRTLLLIASILVADRTTVGALAQEVTG
jgi:hypothetical protein